MLTFGDSLKMKQLDKNRPARQKWSQISIMKNMIRFESATTDSYELNPTNPVASWVKKQEA